MVICYFMFPKEENNVYNFFSWKWVSFNNFNGWVFSTQSILEKRSTYFYFHINIMPSKF